MAKNFKPFRRLTVSLMCVDCSAIFERLENNTNKVRCGLCQRERIKLTARIHKRKTRVLLPKTKQIECSLCRRSESVAWKDRVGLCSLCRKTRDDGFRASGRWGRNQERAAAKRKSDYQKNKDRIASYNKSRSEYLSTYQKGRYWDLKKEPVKFARKIMDASMRTAIWRAIKKNRRSWKSIVGYSLDDLIAHLSARFKPGMTLSNYGEWHIDHITPKSHFKYATSGDEQFRACWSLTNLQPLWAKENMSKGNRYVG